MKKLFIISLLFAQTAMAVDWVVPTENQGEWEPGVDVGVIGGIDQYRDGGANQRGAAGGNTTIDVTQAPHNADPTGVLGCKAAIESAIAAATPGDVIYFPAGDYLLDDGFIYLAHTDDDITFRGAGVGVTTFICDTSDVIFIFNSDGRADGDYVQVLSGTKTKGTKTITVPDSSNYAAGDLCRILFENEEDTARIQAGGIITWSSSLYPKLRSMRTRVASVPNATTITLEKGLPWDGTNHEVTIGTSVFKWNHERIGFEDFSVDFSGADPSWFVTTDQGSQCWFYNLDFMNWKRNTAAGSCIKLTAGRNHEVRKCTFTAVAGASSDGCVESAGINSCLLIDNVVEGPWGSAFYDSGGSTYNVIIYNYFHTDIGNCTIFHNAHPSLQLVEGNIGNAHHSDGYHGSSSNNTIYGNWFKAYVILNRFKRQYVIANNILGTDGVRDGVMSWGNPNIGNGSAEGFAGPTGLSDQEGELDYAQPGYGVGSGSVNTYVIQPEDISVGDFWADWQIRGTLTTRTSDTEGVFTMASGNWFTGASPSGASRLYPNVWIDEARTQGLTFGEVLNVAGSLVTISWPSGVLPAEGTANLLFGMFAPGWQERDLDVQATSTTVENYASLEVGTGSLTDPTADDMPASLAYTAQPSWWTDDSFAGAWPPFNPASPSFNDSAIPAGARYVAASNVAAAPTFDPVGGTFGTTQNVTLASASPSPTIYYTTDGSTPTTGSTLWTGSDIVVSATTTIKAFAQSAGLDDSSVSQATYTISAPTGIDATATTVNVTTLDVTP